LLAQRVQGPSAISTAPRARRVASVAGWADDQSSQGLHSERNLVRNGCRGKREPACHVALTVVLEIHHVQHHALRRIQAGQCGAELTRRSGLGGWVAGRGDSIHRAPQCRAVRRLRRGFAAPRPRPACRGRRR